MVDYFEYESKKHGTVMIRFIWHLFKSLGVREVTILNEQGLPVKIRQFYLTGRGENAIYIPPHTMMRGEAFVGIDNVVRMLKAWRSGTTNEEITQLIEEGLDGPAVHKRKATLSGRTLEERYFDFHVCLNTDLLRKPCWKYFRKKPGTQLLIPTDERGNELFYPDLTLVNNAKWTIFKRSLLSPGPEMVNVSDVST